IFPGGALIGCTAGFLNVPKIKGTHTAMKSGMTAAEAVFDALRQGGAADVTSYPERLRQTWLWDELRRVRNVRPGFHRGRWAGLASAATAPYILRGRAPWTSPPHADNASLKKAGASKPIDSPKPDGKVSFDRLSSVYLSNTNHEENQPCHLTL